MHSRPNGRNLQNDSSSIGKTIFIDHKGTVERFTIKNVLCSFRHRENYYSLEGKNHRVFLSETSLKKFLRTEKEYLEQATKDLIKSIRKHKDFVQKIDDLTNGI